jgi:hypothetical protein
MLITTVISDTNNLYYINKWTTFFFIGTCTYIFRVQISLYGKYNVVPKRSKNLRKQNPKTKRSQKNHNFQIKTQTQKIPNQYHSTRCSAVVTAAARCSPLPELLLSLAGRWTIVAGSLSLARKLSVFLFFL